MWSLTAFCTIGFEKSNRVHTFWVKLVGTSSGLNLQLFVRFFANFQILHVLGIFVFRFFPPQEKVINLHFSGSEFVQTLFNRDRCALVTTFAHFSQRFREESGWRAFVVALDLTHFRHRGAKHCRVFKKRLKWPNGTNPSLHSDKNGNEEPIHSAGGWNKHFKRRLMGLRAEIRTA